VCSFQYPTSKEFHLAHMVYNKLVLTHASAIYGIYLTTVANVYMILDRNFFSKIPIIAFAISYPSGLDVEHVYKVFSCVRKYDMWCFHILKLIPLSLSIFKASIYSIFDSHLKYGDKT
jgi:hypothetical protein